jgi:hypothetical protein
MRALVAAALALLAAAPAAAAAPRCRVPGTRVLEENRTVRLLARREPPFSMYAYTRGHARARRLARNVYGVRPHSGAPPLLAGRWVLYAAAYRDTGGSSLVRVNAVTGRRRTLDFLYAKYTLHTSGAWVLNRRGTVAWITATDGQRGIDFRDDTLVVDVWVAERGRRLRIVDSATYRPFRDEPVPIPDASVRLTDGGHVLRWTRGGEPRSAPLA